MSGLRTFRSFTTEMMKISADVKDADIRQLLSERRGEEYLQGGRLLSNSAADGAQYAIKLGGNYPIGLAAGAYDLQGKKKGPEKYQKTRDYALTAMKGGLTGLGVLGATNAMRGRFGSPSTTHAVHKATQSARRAAGIGAAVAVADKHYRDSAEKRAFVNQAATAPFRGPASQLSESQRTGGFKSHVIHNVGQPPKVVQLGKKFRLP